MADFAVFLSVTTWTFVDYMIGVDTPKLNVPSDFKPTRNDRFVCYVMYRVTPKSEATLSSSHV